MTEPVIIVGAGISGLRAASLLAAQGIECQILEARDRVGGRVLSEEVEGRPELGRFDLGPTWFWPDMEPVITTLIQKLGIQTFEQPTIGQFLFDRDPSQSVERHTLPTDDVQRSMRLVGGIRTLVDAIAETLPEKTVKLSTQVKQIHKKEDGTFALKIVRSNGTEEEIHTRALILTAPLRLVEHTIAFTPALTKTLVASLRNQATWMADQAKIMAIYETPFWREQGLSGQAMSQVGPLQEVHDASPNKGSGALVGFFGISPSQRQTIGGEAIRQVVIDQLVRLYGPAAKDPVAMLYKDWAVDINTAVEEDWLPMSDFPTYGLPETADEWPGLVFAGTETSEIQGGHIEGALRSSDRAVENVLHFIRQTK